MSARILVLEDDPALSESIAAALAGAGYGCWRRARGRKRSGWFWRRASIWRSAM